MKVWEVTTVVGLETVEAEQCTIGRGGVLVFLIEDCITRSYGVAVWSKVELSNPERRLLLALIKDC